MWWWIAKLRNKAQRRDDINGVSQTCELESATGFAPSRCLPCILLQRLVPRGVLATRPQMKTHVFGRVADPHAGWCLPRDVLLEIMLLCDLQREDTSFTKVIDQIWQHIQQRWFQVVQHHP